MTELTKANLETLKEILDRFEFLTKVETQVDSISGGFCLADLDWYDDHNVYIKVKWGVQSDCQDDVNHESWELSRLTLGRATNKDITITEAIDELQPLNPA